MFRTTDLQFRPFAAGRAVITPARRVALAVATAVALSASAVSAGVDLVDVTATSGLSYFGEVGTVFPYVSQSKFRPGAGGDESLILTQEHTGHGAAVGDYDGDGDLDVYFTGGLGVGDKLYRNNVIAGPGEGPAGKTFTDVTEAAFGLAPAEKFDNGWSRVAHFVDLDRDGDLDLVVVSDDDFDLADTSPYFSTSHIFENQNDGSFVEVATNFRPNGYLHAGVAIGDYDGDGWLDIFTTIWGGVIYPEDEAYYPGLNQLWRNTGGDPNPGGDPDIGLFQFEATTFQVGLGIFARESYSALLHDFDDDGDADLYVAVDEEADLYFSNEINENGKFQAAHNVFRPRPHEANDMGVAPMDYDNDGDLDLYLTNITNYEAGFPPSDPELEVTEERNYLWRSSLANSNPTELSFDERAVLLGVADTGWGWGTEWVDVENDGDLDLMVVNGFDAFWAYIAEISDEDPAASSVYQTPSVLFLNDGGSYSKATGTLLDSFPDDSRCLIAFDYDRDGDRDFLITNMDQPARLFENQSTDDAEGGGHWLHVALEPDHLAIGAKVRAQLSNGRNLRRDVIVGRSYLAGTPSEISFGLGTIDVVDRLEITWANGAVEERLAVPADQLLRVVPEPSAMLMGVGSLACMLALRARRGVRGQCRAR